MIRLQDLTVADVMTPGARCVDQGCTAVGAASFLLGDGITGAPVVDAEGGLLGVISITDLLGLLVAGFEESRRDPEAVHDSGRIHVGEVLRRSPVTCTEETSLLRACQTMVRERVHRLVVVRDGATVGVLSAIDLVRALAALGERAALSCAADEPRVREWMSDSLVLLGPDEPAASALERMAEERVRHLLVAERGALLGIVSDRDLVRATTGLRLDFHEHTVREIMTPTPLHTIGPHETLADAAEAMLRHGVSALPVVDRDGLLGLITSRDILCSVRARRAAVAAG